MTVDYVRFRLTIWLGAYSRDKRAPGGLPLICLWSLHWKLLDPTAHDRPLTPNTTAVILSQKPILWPFIWIVSMRRFKWMSQYRFWLEIDGVAAKYVKWRAANRSCVRSSLNMCTVRRPRSTHYRASVVGQSCERERELLSSFSFNLFEVLLIAFARSSPRSEGFLGIHLIGVLNIYYFPCSIYHI